MILEAAIAFAFVCLGFCLLAWAWNIYRDAL